MDDERVISDAAVMEVYEHIVRGVARAGGRITADDAAVLTAIVVSAIEDDIRGRLRAAPTTPSAN